MTRIVALISGKGGVGKTTLAVNVGSVLSSLAHDSVVVDADLSTPNIGFHVGTHEFPATLHDVLLGKALMKDAVYYHHTSGLKFVPGHVALFKGRQVDAKALSSLRQLLDGIAPVAFLDCASGARDDVQHAIAASHEVVAVTTPELPAVLDTLKTLRIAREQGRMVRGVVVNKIRGSPHEMKPRDIESMLEAPILGAIPDDAAMLEAIKIQQPVSITRPGSPSAQALKTFVGKLIG